MTLRDLYRYCTDKAELHPELYDEIYEFYRLAEMEVEDGELRARNTISFDELRILSDLAGSNHLLGKLTGKSGEAAETFNTKER